MNFQQSVKNLLLEAKRGLQFSRLSDVATIIIFAGLVPLIILTFLTVCVCYATIFFYRGISAPLNHLHNIVKQEGNDVKHATQFIIYWVSWPLIFILYIFDAFMSVIFYIQWFMLMLSVYLATLGGVNWQPILMDANFDTNEKYSFKPEKSGLITIVTLWSIYLGYIFLMLVSCIFGPIAIEAVFIAIIYQSIMLFIVHPLVFRKKKIEIIDTPEHSQQ